MTARSNGGFNGNMLDSPENDEVEIEVKDEWGVVDKGKVKKEKKKKNVCRQMKKLN